MDKLEEITEVMKVHPASLILLACAIAADDQSGAMIDSIVAEAKSLLKDRTP